MGNRGAGKTRLPYAFTKKTDEELAALAKSGSEEGDALTSLGLKPYQVEKAKKNLRWRRIWDKARAEWIVEKNKQISASEDVRILSLLAQKTMPENELGDKVVFTVDAPEWFVKSLEKKRARAEVSN